MGSTSWKVNTCQIKGAVALPQSVSQVQSRASEVVMSFLRPSDHHHLHLEIVLFTFRNVIFFLHYQILDHVSVHMIESLAFHATRLAVILL